MPPAYDCDSCQHSWKPSGMPTTMPPINDLNRRREMHCGWIAEEDWIYPISLPSKFIGAKYVAGKPVPGPDAIEWVHDVCPGWAVRQPMIEEIAQASVAFEKGGLASLFPDIAACVAEGVLVMWQARQLYEQQRVIELDETNKG